MDWFSWLSTTNLEPCLIHEYALSFTKNELEHEDIAYFNHEFLQSMGISIAKHRLEILKLALLDRKQSPLLTSLSISRVMIALKKTGKCFSDHVLAWIRREESSSSRALVLVPKRSSRRSWKWKGGLMKRNKRSVLSSNGNGEFDKQEMLLLTNGTPCRLESFLSPMVFDYSFKEEKLYSQNCQDTYWGKDLEEIKWDSMFQNLKPT